jgi:hypothetical protein
MHVNTIDLHLPYHFVIRNSIGQGSTWGKKEGSQEILSSNKLTSNRKGWLDAKLND